MLESKLFRWVKTITVSRPESSQFSPRDEGNGNLAALGHHYFLFIYLFIFFSIEL